MKKIGIYNPYLESKGGGEKVSLALASTLSNNKGADITVITHEPVNLSHLGEYFNIDVSMLKNEQVNHGGFVYKLIHKLPLPGAVRLLLSEFYTYRSLKSRRYDLFINNCYQSNLPNVGKRGIYMCMFPQKLHFDREERGLIRASYKNLVLFMSKVLMYPRQKHGVYTYDKVISNSKFTQSYVKEYWGIESDILYPICENMSQRGVKKEKIILNVGRFFGFDSDSHHKRQDVLLKAFKEMKRLHEDGWELHFAGSVADDRNARAFVDSLESEVEDLPVYFHFDVSYEGLRSLYNRATIYWHATGYGTGDGEKPEKQEHFGITTVEAMSAGAIPIVINLAGQKESVTHKKSGYLWNVYEDLTTYTRSVSSLDANKRQSIVDSARGESSRFSKESFKANVEGLIY